MLMGPNLASDAIILDQQKQREMHALYTAWCKRRDTARRVNTVFYGDDFREIVKQQLKKRYDADTYAAMAVDGEIATYNRLLQDITEKSVIEFEAGLDPWLMPTKQGDVTINVEIDEDGYVTSEAFDSHVENAAYDDLMRQVAPMAFLHPGIAVVPEVVFSPRRGIREFIHQILTPEHFDLEPSAANKKDFQAFSIYVGDELRGEQVVKTTWTLDEWAKFRLVTKPNKEQQWELIDRGANPYGRIPVVMFYGKKPVTSLWGACFGEMLADATTEVNVAQTLHTSHSGMQIKFPAGPFTNTMPPGQIYAQGRPVNWGDGNAVAMQDMQTNLPAFSDAFIKDPRRQCATTVGLQPNEFDSVPSVASGKAMIMQYFGRDNHAKKRAESLRPSVVELYWLDVLILSHELTMPDDNGEVLPIAGYEGTWDGLSQFDQATMAPAAVVLPPYDDKAVWYKQPVKFGVDIHWPEYPVDEAQQKIKDDDDIAKGLVSVIEILKRRKPDITSDAHAEEIIKRNQSINARLLRPKLAGAGGGLLKPGGLAPMADQVASTLAENALLTQDPKDLSAAEKAIDGAAKIGAGTSPPALPPKKVTP